MKNNKKPKDYLIASEKKDVEELTPLGNSVGERLRQKRDELKISLADASQRLCIRADLLRAIEEGDTAKLPEKVYTFGFIGSYARFLDLNEKEILSEYRKEHAEKAEEIYPLFLDPMPKKGAPSFINYFMGVLILALGIGVWFYIKKDVSVENLSFLTSIEDKKPIDTAELKEAENIAPSQTIFSAPSEEPPLSPQSTENSDFNDLPSEESSTSADLLTLPLSTESPPPASPSEITLKATEKVWVQVNNAQGIPIFTKIMKPSESFKIPPGEDFSLTMGNAGGLIIFVNNRELSSLGSPGQVIRNMSLNPEKLLSSLTPKD